MSTAWRISALILLSSLSRLDGKGCFLETSKVTTADLEHSQKPLAAVTEGEKVLSWDESKQQVAWSTVKAKLIFRRRVDELIQLELPHATIHTTQDHPFWSKSQGAIVSLQPASTSSEYGLEAQLLTEDDGLEAENGDIVRIRSIRSGRLATNSSLPATVMTESPLMDSLHLRGGVDSDTVEVMTLCLEPHHWFYVEGVRVHNKGCFIGSTEVTLADGSRPALDLIRVGDEVQSWDEELQQPAVSTVRGVPNFSRLAADLVKLSLASGRHIVATKDHPFWSRTQKTIVSAHPGDTMAEYALQAGHLRLFEELVDEHEAAVNVSAMEPLLQTASRSLGSLRGAEDVVLVKTVCLEPHHWFYANGVRVHNKVCFEPSTPVVMSDGMEKPISELRPDDQVLSWDGATNELSKASVIEIDTFDASDAMLEVVINVANFDQVGRTSQRSMSSLPASRRMVVTADHPLYSARVNGLVSMLPNTTLQNYDLHAAQMVNGELLHHHTGHQCHASVNLLPNSSARPDKVMTLRLDRHHWFFAHGVRVHNKGGGFFRGVSSFRKNKVVRHSAETMGISAFAGHVLVHGGSRRRYGTYSEERSGKCIMESSSAVEEDCQRTIATTSPTCPWHEAPLSRPQCADNIPLNRSACGQWCCHECLKCEHERCVEQIDGCKEFIAAAFRGCEEASGIIGNFIDYTIGDNIYIIWLILYCGPLLLYLAYQREHAKGMKKLQEKLLAMESVNSIQLRDLQLRGTYTENGETKPCSYNLTFDPDGRFKGKGDDDDGMAMVHGKLSWKACESLGKIAFEEFRGSTRIQMDGTLSESHGTYSLRARYMSNYKCTCGNIFVKGRPMETLTAAPRVATAQAPAVAVARAPAVATAQAPTSAMTNGGSLLACE